MELDYKTALTFTSQHGREPIAEFRQTLYEWLKGKRLDADRLETGVTQFNDSTVGTLARLERQDGSIIERFRLTELRATEDGTHTWQSEILGYQRSDGVGEVLVHVTDPRENIPGKRPGPTGVPGFVRLLVQTATVSDGLMPITDGPRILDDLDEQLVHDLIVDETRRLPLVLAPTPEGMSVDQYASEIRELTFGMTGQAGVMVLGPSLMPLLDGHTGYLTLPHGGMRLVPPGTDPATRASVAEGYYIPRHRIDERGIKRVGRHWTWLAREYGNTQPWPKHMQRVMYAITQHERDVLIKDLDEFLKSRERPRPTVEASSAAAPSADTIEDTATPAEDLKVAPETDIEVAPETDNQVAPEPVSEPASAPVREPAAVADTPTATASSEDTATDSGEQGAPTVDADQQVRDALAAALPTEDIINRILAIGGCATVTESLQFALLLAGEYDDLERQVKSAMTQFTGDANASDSYFEQYLEQQARVQQLEAELEEAEGRLDQETRGADYLRRQLVEAGRAEVAYTPFTEDTDFAQDFETVLEIIPTLRFIAFTGDPMATLDLDEMRGSRAAARKTHRALLALHDYARAKADGNFDSGGFSEYLSDHPTGYFSISRKILAPKESDDVARNPKFRSHRELPMPDGRIEFMEAHIKLSAEGSTSPRLHYYDDTGESGLIVVGYIGAHLPNQQS